MVRSINSKWSTRTTLLDLLRGTSPLRRNKEGMRPRPVCGACTVLANGKPINSCLSLALMNDGMEIITIEGLADKDNLHPMHSVFVEHDVCQGY